MELSKTPLHIMVRVASVHAVSEEIYLAANVAKAIEYIGRHRKREQSWLHLRSALSRAIHTEFGIRVSKVATSLTSHIGPNQSTLT